MFFLTKNHVFETSNTLVIIQVSVGSFHKGVPFEILGFGDLENIYLLINLFYCLVLKIYAVLKIYVPVPVDRVIIYDICMPL